MSARDEGATHYFGDDCPGGHRAANVAGVDWDDQETADEANARESAEQEFADLALAARDKHVFVNVTTCACGFQPPMSRDWERHRMGVALAAVVPLLRAQVAADVLTEFADHCLAEANALVPPNPMYGYWRWAECEARESAKRATFHEPDEPVVAAFEADEKGVTRRPVSATAIRVALYDSLSPNFEIDSDGYDDAAVAVAKLVEAGTPTTEGQERSEEKPGPGEATTCPTCSRDIGVSRHGRLASHYKPGTLARCEGDDRG